jgi:hypothetical protein
MLSRIKTERFNGLYFHLKGWSIFSYTLHKSGGWFRIFNRGLSWSSLPGFSVRYGYTKSLKIGKFYFVTI